VLGPILSSCTELLILPLLHLCIWTTLGRRKQCRHDTLAKTGKYWQKQASLRDVIRALNFSLKSLVLAEWIAWKAKDLRLQIKKLGFLLCIGLFLVQHSRVIQFSPFLIYFRANLRAQKTITKLALVRRTTQQQPNPKYKITNFLKLSPSWEAASCVATEELRSILSNPKVNYCVHKSPALVPILGQIVPVHTTSSCPSKIYFNITHPPTY
jgi:hypothetical protein